VAVLARSLENRRNVLGERRPSLSRRVPEKPARFRARYGGTLIAATSKAQGILNLLMGTVRLLVEPVKPVLTRN
jgi:hypothetical protein